MAETQLIEQDYGDGVVGIELNRVPVNALTPDFLCDFGHAIDRFGADASVRAIVISSRCKVLSAGLDLKAAMDFDSRQQAAIVEALNRDFLKLYACPKPVVTAISGAAIAGGLFFVLGADFRVASARSSFGLAEVRVGVDLPIGPMEIALAELDPRTARQLLLTGQPVNVETALERGIVDIVAEKDDVLERAIGEARRLGQLPGLAYGAIKQGLRQETINKIKDGIARDENADWFNVETKAAMQRMIGAGEK